MSITPEPKLGGPSPTPQVSSSTVRVFWLNRAETVARLRAAVTTLARRQPEIEQVILFGSLARGDAVPGSDADLLVIVRQADLPFFERSIRYRPEDAGIGVDVFVYTRDEIAVALADERSFVTHALQEGTRLFPA